MKMYVVVSREKSRSKHAIAGVSYFAHGRFFRDRESADKEISRLEKVYRFGRPDWYLGVFVQEIEVDDVD